MKGSFDMGSLMRQAQKMQQDLKKVQDDLKDRIVESSAGGGAVVAFATGSGELKSIKFKSEVVDPEDIETLEDLTLVAVNNALKEAKALADKEMGEVTGGMGFPGLRP